MILGGSEVAEGSVIRPDRVTEWVIMSGFVVENADGIQRRLSLFVQNLINPVLELLNSLKDLWIRRHSVD